jgi:uncharacterized phage protein (TIGR02220 family)
MGQSKKLGYTFFPKDWNSDDKVFELTLEQRGAFRELIDHAYLTDNQITPNVKSWSRRWNITVDHLGGIMDTLESLELIERCDGFIRVPSCDSRLNIVRRNQQNGQNGGRPKTQKEPKSNPTQKAKERKGKENKAKGVPFQQIVDHLNLVCGTNYKHTSSATQTKITARFNDGFDLDDFIRVIDFKNHDWGNDQKMKSFLRPETLFGTKFESYLENAGTVKFKPTVHNNDPEPINRHLFGVPKNDTIGNDQWEQWDQRQKMKGGGNVG